MDERQDKRAEAVERLEQARNQREKRSEQYAAAEGSSTELPALTDLKAAEEQFAAREAWLAWIDRDY